MARTSGRLPFIALLTATGLSLAGSALTTVALPWFVLETTGSAGRAGLVGASAMLPLFIFGIAGGTLVDRVGFKRISVLADLVSGCAVAAIPLLYHGTGLAFWQLLVLVFVANALNVPALSARRSMLPELAAMANVRLERANTAYEANAQIAYLVGPPVAGVLIAAMGASNVLWVDATTFAFSALVTLVAVPAVVTSASALRGTYFQGVKEGLRFLRRDQVLFALAISLFVTNFLGNPLFAVVLPVYAKEELNSSGALGLLLSVVGIGALLGTMAFGWRLYRWRRRTVWLLAFVTAPLAYWSLVPKPALIVVAIVLFVSELAGGASNPLAVTIRHERIPAELRGRVFSTFSSISMASTPLGIALAGFSIENIGFTPTVLVLAATYQVIALGMLIVPAFHELDRTRHSAPSTS